MLTILMLTTYKVDFNIPHIPTKEFQIKPVHGLCVSKQLIDLCLKALVIAMSSQWYLDKCLRNQRVKQEVF